MTDGRQTVAGAHERMDGHERLCTLRHETIMAAIEDLKDGQKWVIRGVIGMLLAVVAWSGAQLWSQVQPSALARALPVELRR